jgi:hypothetical protein
VLDEMDLMWVSVHRDWRLNERHYGALQGLNKSDTVARVRSDYGGGVTTFAHQFLTWKIHDIRATIRAINISFMNNFLQQNA